MTTSPLAITGVTGAVGGAVARLVTGSGHPARLLLRNPARLPRLGDVDGETEVAVADYGAADVGNALAGVRTLFMVSAAEHPQRLAQHRNFIDAAARAGVEHVVYTSFLAAAPDCTFTLGRDHHATEEHIRASGMRWTFLRDSFYADAFELFAGPTRTIRGPAGRGRVAPVARADVARVAAAVLADPAAHVDRTYDLTGPAAMTMKEIAQHLTRARGRQYSYVDETVEEAYASRAGYGAEQWELDAWVSTYTAIGSGELDVVSQDVLTITGQSAETFEEFLDSSPAPSFD